MKSKEERIRDAHALWVSGVKPGEISAKTEIPPRSLFRYTQKWIQGIESVIQKGPPPIIPNEIEKDLVAWILGMQKTGFPVTRFFIIVKANVICRILGVHQVGDGWYRRFLQRHPILSPRIAQVISRHRNMPEIMNFIDLFNLMLKIIVTEKMDASRVFNMDESGFLKHSTSKKVVVAKGSKNVWSHTMASSFHITYVACVSASGFIVPPLFIISGKRVDIKIGKALKAASIVATDTGFINGHVFRLWLQFFSKSLPNTIQRPILLTLDGYGSHFTSNMTTFALSFGIILVCLPANATHLIQPLDVAVFAPLKRVINQTLFNYMIESNSLSLTKSAAISLALQCWENGVNEQNCISGFRACGLFPLSKTKMIQRYHLYKDNGIKNSDRYDDSWLKHKENIRENILLLPEDATKSTKKRRKTVQATDRIISGNDIVFELDNEAQERKASRKKSTIRPPLAEIYPAQNDILQIEYL